MLAVLLPLLLQAGGAAGIDCSQAMTQTEMNICAARDYAAADAALNEQWSETAAEMRRLDRLVDRTHDDRSGYFETLLEAQRLWIRFRDAHCRNEGYYARGGSLEPLLRDNCKAALTRERTDQLRQLAEWPG